LNPKELKAKLKLQASKEPDKYYPTSKLHSLGFSRKQCGMCKTYFWTTDASREICGNPNCSGGFLFLQKPLAKNKMNYVEVWKKFSSMFRGFGYTPIKRYPVVSRWNPTTPFTIASIAAFQPHVVSGEAKPPANPLVIPQLCLRFSDIDNVGLTGHNVLFSMLGQHAFVPKNEFKPEHYLEEIYTWLTKGMGIRNKDLTFHEDAWVGGNSCGHSLEFFSGGLEIGNQVYMTYEQTDNGIKELPIKVLDMGMGQERVAWFMAGRGMPYDATFPSVMNKIYKNTGITSDLNFMTKFLPYAAYLNIDEVEDIGKAWKNVAASLYMDVNELKNKILPLSALYSVAEHSRALLVALSDSALPSNTGGGYNLRVVLRRALDFIEKYGWNINLYDVCEWHARDLRIIFPELSENLEDVKKILDVEINKYESTKQKSHQIIADVIKKGETTTKDLLRIYDERGISPELISRESQKLGKKITVPDNFYSLVSELHEKTEVKHVMKEKLDIDLTTVPATKVEYYGDYSIIEFKAKVLKVNKHYLVLDRTYFYPTSGGQIHDLGSIEGNKVVDVVREGDHIIHILEKEATIPLGKDVHCIIDKERRFQLAQHHTSAHILNAAAKRVLGHHINQAGAYKQVDKARLDITHYAALNEKEITKIEEEANKIIKEAITINKTFVERGEAEVRYGMGIYQGGVAPGKILRIVEIPEVDVEACGGTHLNNTKEAGKIKIIKSSKISDSIVRIEYVAGKAAEKESSKEENLLEEAAAILGVGKKGVAIKAAEVFRYWKDVVKKGKSIKLKYSGDEEDLSDKEILEKTANILKTQVEHVPSTLKRFLKELEGK